ncbi:hypothetical protein TNCV_1596841 [Trichonephila clavipes]|nr:hypothetical protein TNCV_1596841 [Trichonephila clavipes]
MVRVHGNTVYNLYGVPIKNSMKYVEYRDGGNHKHLVASRAMLALAANSDANVSISAATRAERLCLRLDLQDLTRPSKIESGFVTKDYLVPVQLPRARHDSKRRRGWVYFQGSSRNGRHDPNCPSARCLHMIRGAPNEGA